MQFQSNIRILKQFLANLNKNVAKLVYKMNVDFVADFNRFLAQKYKKSNTYCQFNAIRCNLNVNNGPFCAIFMAIIRTFAPAHT